MLGDRASLHAKSPIISISPDASLLDAIDLMSSRGIRRVRVSRDGEHLFTTIDAIIRLLSEMSKLFTDDRSLRQVRIGSTNLVKPPVIKGDYTVRETAKIMSNSNVDFAVIMGEELESIITVTDLMDSVEEGELDVPVLEYASRRYPTIGVSSKLIDAVKLMSTFRVRSVLATDGEMILGSVSSRHILKLISKYGFSILGDDIESSVKPIRAFAEPSSTLGNVIRLMRLTGSEVAVLNIGTHVVGVVDEARVISGIAGISEPGNRMA